MTRSSAIKIALVSLLALQQSRAQPTSRDDVSAPVHYDNEALALSTKNGTAVVKFNSTEDGDKVGAHYHYRFLSSDGKETSGEGDIYENYKRPVGGGRPVDRGSKTVIQAGAIELTWSFGSTLSGWIYYLPETMTVQPVTAKLYDELKLDRFKR